jgi:hypothetical protein
MARLSPCGQLRSTRSGPARSRRRFHDVTKPSSALRGPAPRGASCDGPPSPRRLEQPFPGKSPISDAPCRRRRHRHTGLHQPAGQLSVAPPHRYARADLRGRDRRRIRAWRRGCGTVGAPSVVSRSAGLPRPRDEQAHSGGGRLAHSPHRSRRGRCREGSSEHSADNVLGQRLDGGFSLAAGRPVGTRDASDRLLPSHLFIRVPAPRGFPTRHARCACAIGETACFHGSAARFGGRRAPAAGVVFPLRCARAVPLTSLSLPAPCTSARTLLYRVGCRGHPLRERVNVDALDGGPETPSIGGRPSPCDALSSVRLRPCDDVAAGLPRCRLSTPSTLAHLTMGRSSDPRSHEPRCRRGCASLDLGAARRFLQPNTTRGHTQRALDPRARVELLAPLLAGTNRCRLRWLPDASPHREPASHDLLAAACARSAPLAWTGQIMGRRTRERQARCWTNVARALLEALRAPGSPSAVRCEAWRAPPRIAQVETHPVDAASRKDAASGEVEVLSAVPEPVREQRGFPVSCAPGPEPRHAASAEALLGGSRACLTMAARLTLTRQAPAVARPAGPGVPKHPLVRRVAAPVAASTIDSARGQMCRELHAPDLLRNGASRNEKAVVTMLFFVH